MKNTFGQNLSVTLFGESHGAAVGAVVDGLTPGLSVDEERIAGELVRRRPQTAIDTPRVEKDAFQIVSGVFDGKTTGTPLCIMIPNENTKSSDYQYGVARPSHADYTAFCKYHGFEDYRGGGHFSGRVTAALVAVGGILLPALEQKGIRIATHILQCHHVKDRPFETVEQDVERLKMSDFPTLDVSVGQKMQECILSAKEQQTSVGGMTQTAVVGLPAGVGEPWFDSVEGLLSHALFSIGGIKGVAFGDGFGFAEMTGDIANDSLRAENGRIYTETNRNGGINGGITNGMPILFDCAVKPTPTIARPQKTVDFIHGENTEIAAYGRHDPAIIRRICPVIDSVTAIVLADLLTGRFGTDFLSKGSL